MKSGSGANKKPKKPSAPIYNKYADAWSGAEASSKAATKCCKFRSVFVSGWEQGESSQAEAVIADIRLFTPSTPPAAPLELSTNFHEVSQCPEPGEGPYYGRLHVERIRRIRIY